MFAGATSFNSDLSKWDVSSATTMSNMFWSAKSFTGDFSKWDVSSVITTYNMFSAATSFNVDVSKWDVSNVANMNFIFFMRHRSDINFARLLGSTQRQAK